MATLSALDDRGELHRLDPGLPARVQEERIVYLSERMRRWIEEKLPDLGSTWNIETSPLEQFVELVETFCSGKELAYEQRFHALRYRGGGMWELKTADLRVFGWFNCKDCFVAHCADTADRIKEHKLYHGYCGDVERFRNDLDLDEPKYIPGDDPHAVVSNFYYP